MEAKYTPEKWEINKKGVQTIISVGTAYIAIVMPNHVGKEESEANAKLIVAAPELLESLIELIPFASEWINDNHPAMKKAKSAIKKATK